MKTKVNFNSYSESYDCLMQEQHAKFGDIAYYSQYKVQITKAIFNNLYKPKILEYGCGIGRNLSYLQSAFPDSSIFGFDISAESLVIAKNKNTKTIILNQNDLLKYENYFDIIFIANVYHHIAPNLRSDVTKAILKLMRISGKVIIFEHNPYNPLTRNMVDNCVFDSDAVLIKKTELINIFKYNGFDVTKAGYSLFLPPILKKFNFIERTLKWLPLGAQYYAVFEKYNAQ